MSIEEDQIRAAFYQSLTFRDLSDEDLQKLVDRFQMRAVPKGEQIITQGEKGEELFVVLAGQFEVVLTHSGADISKIVRVLGPGDIVGEIAVLIDTRRTASVRSVIDSKVAVISKEDFHTLLKESPSITLSLCQALGRAAAASFRLEAAIPFARSSQFPDATRCRAALPDKVIAACRAVPVARAGMQVTIAMVDAYDEDSRRFLTKVISPLVPEFVAVSEEDFDLLARNATAATGITVERGGRVPEVRLVNPGVEALPSKIRRWINSSSPCSAKRLPAVPPTSISNPNPASFRARIRIDGNLAELPDHGDRRRGAPRNFPAQSDVRTRHHRTPAPAGRRVFFGLR